MVGRIVPIVEGHGEVKAVPLLLRRFAETFSSTGYIDVGQPIRRPRYSLVRPGWLERDVEVAARNAGQGGGVLILIDSEGEPPCRLGPELLERARGVRPGLPISVVLAHQEYEAWFLAAASSLRGQRGLPHDLESPSNPEGIRDAKGWLRDRLPRGSTYSETLDQPALTATFDLQLARSAGSFDKCFRELQRLMLDP